MEDINRSLSDLQALFSTQGELMEADFDKCNIGNNMVEEGIPKDALVMWRRRSVILNNRQVVEREIAKKQAIIDEKAAKAAEKVAREAEKIRKTEAKALKDAERAQRLLALQDDDMPIDQHAQDQPPRKIRKKTTKVYCICHRQYNPHHGQMVECSNKKNCTSGEWFHYGCLNLPDDWIVPEEWHCVACTYKE